MPDKIADALFHFPDNGLRALSCLAYANGFTHWHYKPRQEEQYLSEGYFEKIKDLIAPGDQVTVSVSNPDGMVIGGFFRKEKGLTLIPLMCTGFIP